MDSTDSISSTTVELLQSAPFLTRAPYHTGHVVLQACHAALVSAQVFADRTLYWPIFSDALFFLDGSCRLIVPLATIVADGIRNWLTSSSGCGDCTDLWSRCSRHCWG